MQGHDGMARDDAAHRSTEGAVSGAAAVGPAGDAGVDPRLYDGGEGDSERHAELRAHYESFFDISCRELTWPAGRDTPGFRVLEVPPNEETPLWTYATIGCFAGAPKGETGEPAVEFILMSETQAGRCVELATMAARYHAFQPLVLGQALVIGEPWLPGATCDAFLVSPPHLFGPSFEHAPVARVRWLLPITPAERRFLKTHGAPALEAELERAPIRYGAADRPSVIA